MIYKTVIGRGISSKKAHNINNNIPLKFSKSLILTLKINEVIPSST